MTPTAPPVIDDLLGPVSVRDALAADVLDGLTRPQKALPPKWFYDDRGSELFDAITRLPEYYPTECERAILQERAHEIAKASGADTVVELGSGTSDKTRTLLDAFHANGQLQRFCPFDVSAATLAEAAVAIGERYPGLEVHAVVGDFERHLGGVPRVGTRLFAFLGGTIGNFTPATRRSFLLELAEAMRPGDSLLLGTDLVKPVERLLLAYDDPAGVTAEFNRNVLHVLNRELGASFDPGDFEHEARWDAEQSWVEMHLVARRAHSVRIADVDLEVSFEAGESIHTEVSSKFRPRQVADELADAGLLPECFWTDPAGDFGLSLAFSPD